MGDIYRAAQKVIIWLGVEDGSTEPAFNFVKMICDHCQTSADRPRDKQKGAWYRQWSPQDSDWLTVNLQGESHLTGWRAFDALLKRSWWYRTWIIQEGVLAKDALIVCRKLTLEWESFQFVISNIGANISWISDLLRQHQCPVNRRGVDTVSSIVYLREPDARLDLLRILVLTAHSCCTEARDKV
jgi:hypothetical protein